MKAGQHQNGPIHLAKEQGIGKAAHQRTADAPINHREMVRGTPDAIELPIEFKEKGLRQIGVARGIPILGCSQIGSRILVEDDRQRHRRAANSARTSDHGRAVAMSAFAKRRSNSAFCVSVSGAASSRLSHSLAMRSRRSVAERPAMSMVCMG